MIKIIDNVVSSTYQDQLESTFFSKSVPWKLSLNLTDNYKNGEIGFIHDIIKPNYTSEYFGYVLPLVYEICEKSEVNLGEVFLARSFLQLPSISLYENDLFHIDTTDEHIVFLYYVNNSDGDTLISSQKYSLGKNPIYPRDFQIDIQEKISPKKGRVVVFDGKFYHAAGVPKKNNRCVLNFNIVY